MQQQWTISLSGCDVWRQVDFIQQPAMKNSVVGPRRNSKALAKAKLAPKKSHGQCLVVLCWFDLLQFSESWRNHNIWAQQINEMHWKLQCLAVDIGQQKWSNSSPWQCSTACCTTTASSWTNWAMKFYLLCFATFTWPLTNKLPLLQAFW